MTCTVACYDVFFPHHHVEKSAKNQTEAAAPAILRWWYIPYEKSKKRHAIFEKRELFDILLHRRLPIGGECVGFHLHFIATPTCFPIVHFHFWDGESKVIETCKL